MQLLQFRSQQVRNHLGVGFRLEHHPRSLQLLPQSTVVLNDSVLHHRQRAIAAAVRMGIALFRFAMGGPAGVANAALPGSALGFKTGRQVPELALGPKTGQLALTSHRGNPSGVVTAVLQLPQTLQELRRRFSGTHQGNDSAHTKKARLKPGRAYEVKRANQ